MKLNRLYRVNKARKKTAIQYTNIWNLKNGNDRSLGHARTAKDTSVSERTFVDSVCRREVRMRFGVSIITYILCHVKETNKASLYYDTKDTRCLGLSTTR